MQRDRCRLCKGAHATTMARMVYFIVTGTVVSRQIPTPYCRLIRSLEAAPAADHHEKDWTR